MIPNFEKAQQSKILSNFKVQPKYIAPSHSSDMIQKGEMSDILLTSYHGGTPITFDKSGKEIKEKMPAIISALEAQKTIIEAQMGVFKSQIGSDPSEELYSRYPAIKIARYGYEISNPAWDNMSEKYNEATELNICCQKYNELAYTYRSLMEDITASNIIMQNLVDSKKYTLSVNQLIALNFN